MLYSNAMAKKKLHGWRIVEIGKKGSCVGRVEAETADEAVKRAVEEYGLNPQRAKRLVAQREAWFDRWIRLAPIDARVIIVIPGRRLRG